MQRPDWAVYPNIMLHFSNINESKIYDPFPFALQ